MPADQLTLLQSVILGFIEGITEYLPISSTGHLILGSAMFGLDLSDPGVNAYLIVIQGAAVLAVASLYSRDVKSMALGIAGRDAEGLRLLGLLITSFIPAAIVGLLLGDLIKERLFSPTMVAVGLGVGGVVMIVIDRIVKSRGAYSAAPPDSAQAIRSITLRMALIIGCVQCLALWPGASRSMVTIVAGILVGLHPRAAAEYSFLLALPTLGMATLYEAVREGENILNATGAVSMFAGLVVAFIVAWASIKFLISYLTRHGLSIFGWYRIVLAIVVVMLAR